MKRSAVLPDVKTFDEQGIKGFDATLWFGLFAPKGVNDEITKKLGDAMQRVFTSAQVKQDFQKRGLDAYEGGSKQFGEFVVSEIQVWGDVIKKAGIKVE
jgi:tripartite-type tricarboxylate transporter receptor subunit TctC